MVVEKIPAMLPQSQLFQSNRGTEIIQFTLKGNPKSPIDNLQGKNLRVNMRKKRNKQEYSLPHKRRNSQRSSSYCTAYETKGEGKPL